MALVERFSRRTIQNKKGLKESAGLIKDMESPLSEKQEKSYEIMKETNKNQLIKRKKVEWIWFRNIIFLFSLTDVTNKGHYINL